MIDRIRQGAELTRRNEVLEGKYPQLEVYKNREFQSFGFPEMYMLAKNEFYGVIGNIRDLVYDYTNHFGDNVNDHFITNNKLLFKYKNKALEVFGDRLYSYNFFEDLIAHIIECYPDTSVDAIKGIAYHTYKNIKDEKLDQKTLYYMLDTINKYTNLWVDSKTMEIRINSSQRLKDVMSPPYNVPKIEQVKITEVEGDLNDVATNLKRRLSDLSECVDKIEIDLELRAKLKKKGKEIDAETKVLAVGVEDLEALMYSASDVLSNIVKAVEKDILNLNALNELDVLQRYRGKYEPMGKIAIKTKYSIGERLPRADKILYNSNRSNSAKTDKNEDKIGRIREEFIRVLKLENYKLEYIEHLIGKGLQSRDAYFSELM